MGGGNKAPAVVQCLRSHLSACQDERHVSPLCFARLWFGHFTSASKVCVTLVSCRHQADMQLDELNVLRLQLQGPLPGGGKCVSGGRKRSEALLLLQTGPPLPPASVGPSPGREQAAAGALDPGPEPEPRGAPGRAAGK